MPNPDLPKLTNNWRDMLRSFAEARTGDNEFLPNGSLRYGHIRRALCCSCWEDCESCVFCRALAACLPKEEKP